MMVDAHTHLFSPHPSVRILSHEEVTCVDPVGHEYFAVGAHPWDLEKTDVSMRGVIRDRTMHPNCVAVGETGFDLLRGDSELQEKWFMWHWDLAEEQGLPLVLHLVRGASDLMRLLKYRRPRTAWLWHAFQGPLESLPWLLQHQPDLYFSLGPREWRRPNAALIWDSLPPERRLLETDDSGVALTELYREAKADEKELQANFQRLFNIDMREAAR